MNLTDLTVLQFNLIAIIDAGNHEGVTFEEVKGATRTGDLFQWLSTRFPDDVDMSIYTGDHAANGRDVVKALQVAADVVEGRERKKMGVEHNGICLLAALVTEVIQRREWKA